MAVEQRANIKFCLKLGKTAGEAYEMMKSLYGGENSLGKVIDVFYASMAD
jgi:hypothetical protein